MGLEEVTSELLALRKLYGLLQKSEDNELDAVAVHLDVTARMLLKDLLDQASERLLETYSQIITDQLSRRLACSASSSLQPADSTQVARNSNLVIPNIKSDSGFGRMISYTDATPTAEESPWLLGISSRKPGLSSNHCTICAQNSAMQQFSSAELKRRPMTDRESILDNHICISSVLVQGSRLFPLPLDKRNQKPPRQKKIRPTNTTSVEAQSSNREISPQCDLSYAIKRIEAQILVLQHLSGLADPLKSAGRQAKERETKIPSQIGNQFTKSHSTLASPLKENGKSTTGMVGRTETPMWSTSQVWAPDARASRQTSNFVHGFRVPKSVAESEMSPSQTVNKESVQPRLLVPSQDTIHSMTSASSSNRMLTRGKNLKGRVNIHRPATIEQKINKNRTPSGGNKACKMDSPIPTNRKLEYQMESEESSSGSPDSSLYSSSSMRSQQTSRSSSYTSEDYSRSCTDYTDFSWGSRSESKDSSSFYSDLVPSPHGHMEPSLKKVGPTTGSRPPNSGRAIGKLRKIKNKLGIIFHHHHHHHHHHHNENDKDRVHKSKWKNMKDYILRGPNKNQVNRGRKIVDKSKNSIDKRSQGGHFHTLVEGLLRHMRHSKKKKGLWPPGPGGIRRNKKKKKLHWWQMMRRGGGVKLPKAGRQPKLKLANKRTQLGAPKS